MKEFMWNKNKGPVLATDMLTYHNTMFNIWAVNIKVNNSIYETKLKACTSA